MWLDFWGYRLGVPREEYNLLPMSDICDFISIQQICNGTAEEVTNEDYLPDWR